MFRNGVLSAFTSRIFSLPPANDCAHDPRLQLIVRWWKTNRQKMIVKLDLLFELKQGNVIIVLSARVVLSMRVNLAHFEPSAEECISIAPRYTQLYRPLVNIHPGETESNEIVCPSFNMENIAKTALDIWLEKSGNSSRPVTHLQRDWDLPLITFEYEAFLSQINLSDSARLLSPSTKESGARLHALLIVNVGCFLDNTSLRLENI